MSETNVYAAGVYRVYIGCYGPVVGVTEFDSVRGELGELRQAAVLENVSFLVRSADARFWYAVSEVGAGRVHGFAADAVSGGLSEVDVQASGGAGPCDVALSPNGRLLAVANYGGGSVTVFELGAEGRLGRPVAFFQHMHFTDVFPGRQKRPHAHGVTWSPDGALLLVPDLGGDRVYVYAVQDGEGCGVVLVPHAGQPWLGAALGAGPRHATFAPDGRQVYVVNELSNTVSVYAYRAGAARPFSAMQVVSTLPPEGYDKPTKAAEIAVHPDGCTVYASNRGLDSIAVFARDPGDGRLELRAVVPVPAHPRHFVLSPDGRWLLVAGMEADVVAVLAVDGDDGVPRLTGGGWCRVGAPACVRL